MKKKGALFLSVMLSLTFFTGISDLGSRNAQGTDVSGIYYDGAGGPWTLAGSPYIVIGNVTIPAGETLTIEPGVDVRVNGHYSIYVDGTLTSIGTEMSRIDITSNMATPAPNDWNTIRVNSTGRVDIKYNEISYGYFGIELYQSSNNNITNSLISYNYDNGIYLAYSTMNSIENNSCMNNSNGLYLSSSSNNTISSNYVSGNANGLFLYGSSDNNITMNFISYNSGTIIIDQPSSQNNTVTYNNISYNSDGIVIASGSNNRIFHNNILNNTNQASDFTNSNLWNDTYPSGGNYWSNFSPTCIDYFEGSITPQTSGFPDHICDTQHNIDADSTDYYPLTDLVGYPIPSNTGTIKGRIVDENSNPLEDAIVSIFNSTNHKVGETTTNSSGEFIFMNVQFGSYRLTTSIGEYWLSDYYLTVTISSMNPSVDLGNITLSLVSGTIEIANPQSNAQITIGSTILVHGWANSTDTPTGHLQDITIRVRLFDSEGNEINRKTSSTTSAGYFNVEFLIPDGISLGLYSICVETDYGNVSAECVSVNIVVKKVDLPWTMLLIISIIITMVVVIIVIIVIYVMAKKERSYEKPSGYDPYKRTPPSPPPLGPPSSP